MTERLSEGWGALGPRQRHVLALWDALCREPALPQLDRWLRAALAAHRNFGKRDRLLYASRLFAAVRFGVLALAIERAHRGAPPFDAAALAALAAATATPAATWDALRALPPERLFALTAARAAGDDGGGLPALAAWAAHIATAPATAEARLVWHGLPPWLAPAVAARAQASQFTPAETARFVAAHDTRPPLWLRATRPAYQTDVMGQLRTHGFDVAAHPTGAIRAEGPRGIYDLAAYREGRVEIQDLASQAIGAAVAARPGQVVWDCCAGGGGKTLQLAATLDNRGAVYASDVREHKLQDLRQRARRAGLHNIRTFVWDGRSQAPLEREVEKRGGFDWVLVDAPCSGSGTWRRNPDGRLRVGAADVATVTALQRAILAGAQAAVRPGGHLVYATCSFLWEENEALVADFLEQNKGFMLQSAACQGSPWDDADTTFTAVFART